METKALYTRVILSTPMKQNEFIAFFNETVRELTARYGERFVAGDGGAAITIDTIDGPSGVRDIYFNCIADNIMYLKNGNPAHKTEYYVRSEQCYKTVWKSLSRGRRVKKETW